MAHVLVVEDEPNIRELLQTVLKMDGHQVTAAADGREGLDRALANPPDLAILDVLMPGINGIELAGLLRRSARTAHVPIMIMTAWNDIRDRALEAGADEFLPKPVLLKDLRRRVAALLAAKRPMRSDQVLRSLADLEELESRRRETE